MDATKLSNLDLTAALHLAMQAVKETRGSANLKRTRRARLSELKAEAQRRINLGAW